MMPDFALGLWQSKLRYRTQEELLSVARDYAARSIPLSAIVADFFNWPVQGDWRFGDDVYAILSRYPDLRQRLRPYVRELMRAAHETGAPLMCTLFYAFPDDARCWEIDDQYMFGGDILVAPILKAGETQRGVYLPVGTDWVDAWTGRVFAGGQTIVCPAPQTEIPVFERKDAAVLGLFPA